MTTRSPDLGDLLEIFTALQWDETYLEGLERFLRSYQVESVLDCAGGIGFPVLELKKRGWDVSYADGSAAMVRRFLEKQVVEKVVIPSYSSDWRELSQKVPGTFDALLCRGNSLVYMDSWGVGPVLTPGLWEIQIALGEFFKKLKPGGVLYLDIYREDQRDNGVSRDLGEKIVAGHKVSLDWQINCDHFSRRRIWTVDLSVDGQSQRFELCSFLLYHAELITLLYKVGFSDVAEVEIDGERIFKVYRALK